MVDSQLSHEERREVVQSALSRDRQVVEALKRAQRIKVAILALCFAFVAATSIGIQLSNRAEAQGRNESLESIEKVQAQQKQTLDKIEAVTGPEAQQQILDVVEQIVAHIDCNDREALQAALAAIRSSGLTISTDGIGCSEEPPPIGGR